MVIPVMFVFAMVLGMGWIRYQQTCFSHFKLYTPNIGIFYKMYFLELLNGALLTDLFVMALCVSGVLDGWAFPHFKDTAIAKWYRKFWSVAVVVSDVTIIMLGVILAKVLYPFCVPQVPFSQ
jgi:hypothetical protein